MRKALRRILSSTSLSSDWLEGRSRFNFQNPIPPKIGHTSFSTRPRNFESILLLVIVILSSNSLVDSILKLSPFFDLAGVCMHKRSPMSWFFFVTFPHVSFACLQDGQTRVSSFFIPHFHKLFSQNLPWVMAKGRQTILVSGPWCLFCQRAIPRRAFGSPLHRSSLF